MADEQIPNPIAIPTPTPSVPTPMPHAPVEPIVAPRPAIHTLQSDLDRAMTATDPAAVQEMIATAREQEAFEKDEGEKQVARSWLSKGAVLLIVLALIGIVYGAVHYSQLTVPVVDTASVGVFPSTTAIVANETTLTNALQTLLADTTLSESKPALVPIVTDGVSQTLLTPTQFFAYIGANAPEPLAGSFGIVRLGVVQTESEIIPFIIATMNDPEVAAKELQNAEENLASMLAPALAISAQTSIGGTFTSGYRYNIPVRILERALPETGESAVTMLYGYPTDQIVVLTTNPSALKAVYDTIISQR